MGEVYLTLLRRVGLFAMSIVQSYLDKPTFICNAHHKLRLAVEGIEVGLRNAEVSPRHKGLV